jgi:hypothetical protein
MSSSVKGMGQPGVVVSTKAVLSTDAVRTPTWNFVRLNAAEISSVSQSSHASVPSPDAARRAALPCTCSTAPSSAKRVMVGSGHSAEAMGRRHTTRQAVEEIMMGLHFEEYEAAIPGTNANRAQQIVREAL